MSSDKDRIIIDKQYFDQLVSLSENHPEIKDVLERIIRSHEENEKARAFIKQAEQELRNKGIDI
ncbi:MAG: hypothetical protein AB7V56_04875 [Candidatus Nitrosocosmicus sp.]